ncbi:MAG: hypothetical protein HY000_41730 [Planctomycetes bacterium]|nr:hypothetical protein [Planctomycetota bacterium]
MSEPDLTDEELRHIRQLLADRNAQSATIERADTLPPVATCIGKAGRFSLWLVKKLGVAWVLLLLPLDALDVYNFYRPFVQTAYQQVADFAERFDTGKVDPQSVPPTRDYIAFGSDLALPPLRPPLAEFPGVTVVASTGVPPTVLTQSTRILPTIFHG